MRPISSYQSNTTPRALTDVIDFSEQVQNYFTWLSEGAGCNTFGDYQEKTKQYVYEAMKPVSVGEQEVYPYAPFQPSLSAFQTTTPKQRLILRVIGLLYSLGLIFYSIPGLELIIAIVTVFYISDLLLYFVLSMLVIEQSTGEQVNDTIVHALADADWPPYTILCPLYHEAQVIPQFVQAMTKLDYPVDKLQIFFLTEEDDIETHTAIQAMHLPMHFQMLIVPDGQPRTKPRACNYGLLHATGDYVVIYDAEDIPDPLQLKKAVLTFANYGSDLACVQAKLNFYNTEQNLLTRWFTAEYSTWFDMTLAGLQKLRVPLPLGGTSNHFPTELLRKIGAWDVFNVTEDCDLGLRLAHHNLKTVIVDSTTYEEANSQFRNWIRQRSRWIKGYVQTYLVHMRHPIAYLRSGHLREFLSLQLIIGGKFAILFINPLMWMLLLIYILFHTFVANVYHTLYPMSVLYMGTICLVFGNFMYIYIHLIGCMKRGQYSLAKWTLLMPIYWAMSSVAGYIALYQLVFKPHHWEKTLHGLHLRTSRSSSKIAVIAKSDGLEVLATHSSSSTSLTREGFELEFSEKRLRLKVHTSGKLPAIPKHSIVSARPQDNKTERVTITEVPEDRSREPLPDEAQREEIAWLAVSDTSLYSEEPPLSASQSEVESQEVTQKLPSLKASRHKEEPSLSASQSEVESQEITQKLPSLKASRHKTAEASPTTPRPQIETNED